MNIDKNIVLIGMPGCGKTTIGKKISKELKIEFCDLDEMIEKDTGMKISDIFLNGEEYFRDIETDICKKASEKKGVVISTGGGVVKRKENIVSLKKNGIIVFIDRALDKIIADVDTSKRPLLKDGKDKLYKLYEERYDLYNECADIVIKNDISLKVVIENIKNMIKNI